MDNGNTEELAEAIGLKSVVVVVNGGNDTITLRPLSLKQQIELRRKDLPTQEEYLAAALYEAAKRGGYQGTPDELADMIEGDEILAASEALVSLSPRTAAVGQTAQGVPIAAETGIALSGGSSSSD